MKKKLLAIAASLLIFPSHASAHELWTGTTNSHSTTQLACVKKSNVNARLNPWFGNNIRAMFRIDSCGIYQFTIGEFHLIRFYVEELQEWRSYWIHNSLTQRY